MRIAPRIATVLLALIAAGALLAYRTIRIHRPPEPARALPGVRPAGVRPNGDALWASYLPVCYADHHAGTALQAAWHSIGGAVGDQGAEASWLPCAAELSYALDRSGAPIPSVSGVTNRNSDGRRYILSARLMRRYLRARWGRADYAAFPVGGCRPDSTAFLGSLHLGGRTAVFASDAHVGVIRAGYADPYLLYLQAADIWILPGR